MSRRPTRRRFAFSRTARAELLEPRYLLTTTFSDSIVECCSTDGITEIDAVDFDGDGDTDVLSASANTDQIVWHENLDALGTFSQSRLIADDAQGAKSVQAADMDLDGDLDVLVGSARDRTIGWYENVGDQQFRMRHVIDNRGSGLLTTHAYDLDSDGDLDVLAGFRGDNAIAWYENLLDGTFTRRDIAVDVAFMNSLFAADLDGDRDLDVVSLTHESNDSGKLSWYENLGNRRFSSRLVVEGVFERSYSATVGNVFADGRPELIAAGEFDRDHVWRGPKVAVYARPDEYFERRFTIIEEARLEHLQTADLDGDGFLDLMAVDAREGTFAWYRHPAENVAGFAGPRIIRQDGPRVSAYQASDVDSDGDLDVIAASYTGDEIVWYENRSGQGDFSVVHPVTPALLEPSELALADLDGDGDDDLVAVSQKRDVLGWYANEGEGQFAKVRMISQGAEQIGAIEFADLDHDGDLDVLAASPRTRRVIWLENRNQGMNFDRVHLVADSLPDVMDVSAIDHDQDGKYDIFTVSRSGAVRLFVQQDEAGTFSEPTVVGQAGRYATGIEVADVDADGDADIVISRWGPDTQEVSWLESRPGELPILHIVSTDISEPTSVDVADIDGDSFPDILVAGFGRVAWFKNQNDGSFLELTVTEDEAAASHVRAIDMDVDGDLDFVVSSESRDRIVWYENKNGRGAIGTPQMVRRRLDRVAAFVVADFDRDGLPDVASAATGVGQIAIHRQRLVGDVNNDRAFDSSDLVAVFQAGAYEDSTRRQISFEEGDWNGDRLFDSSDLVYAFACGHYQAAPPSIAVPLREVFQSNFLPSNVAKEDFFDQLDNSISTAMIVRRSAS